MVGACANINFLEQVVVMTEKIFTVLEAVGKTKGTNSVSVIQKLTGLPRSTVHRILQSMEKSGMIVYRQDKGYSISQKLQLLCLSSNQNTDFLEVMIPLVKEIAEKTQETVSVNVLENMERICIYRVEGRKRAINNVHMGERGPLFSGSTGRVLTASLSPLKFEKALIYGEENGTITAANKKEVIAKVETCRQDGYAVSMEERYEGCWSIAVPIVSGITRETLGALSVNSVISSYSEDVKDMYIKMLREASQKAGLELLR